MLVCARLSDRASVRDVLASPLITGVALVTACYAVGGHIRLLRLGLSEAQAEALLACGAGAALIACALLECVGRRAPVAAVRAPPCDLLCGAAAVMVCEGLAALNAKDGSAAWAAFTHRALVFGVFFAVLAARDVDRTAFALSRLGLGFLAAQGALLLGGLIWLAMTGNGGWPFAGSGTHQHTAAWPRYYGLGVNPFYAAVTTLAALGLVVLGSRTSRNAHVRWAPPLALALCATTLSFPTLLLPMLAGARLRSRSLQVAFAGAVFAGALTVLYVHPLRLAVGERTLMLGELHPSYDQDGLGPSHMPVQSYRLGAIELTAHATAYADLALRALSCFGEAPALGVGAGNFGARCKVWTMDTYGHWRDELPAHNQYLGMLAEQGAFGCLAWAVLAWRIARRLDLRRRGGWLLALYLLAGFGCPVLHVVPLAAWLGGLFATSRAAEERLEDLGHGES